MRGGSLRSPAGVLAGTSAGFSGGVERKHRWLIYLAAVIMMCLTLQSLRLGHQVNESLSDLATAETDNLQWTLSQVEVDLLKYRVAILTAEADPEEPGHLSALRRTFDVYYSRIATVLESELYASIRSGSTERMLHNLMQSLEAQTPIIDGSNTRLLAGVQDLKARSLADKAAVRDLALRGVVLQAEIAGAKRTNLHTLYAQLGIVLTLLVCAMLTTVMFLTRLYRRSLLLMAQNAQSAARMETMISASLDAIVMVGADGTIITTNAAAEKLFGLSPGQARGSRLSTLLPDLCSYRGKRGANWLAQLDLPNQEEEGRIRLTGAHQSGASFPAELSVSISQTGKDPVLVGYIRDISPRLQAEEQLRQARDDALAGERAKDRLLTVMSHEMRTPLNGILGALDLLYGTPLSSQQHRFLDAMRVSGDILLHHVNDVLELSRLEADAEPEAERVFDLERLVNGLVESQQAQATANSNELSAYCNLGALTGVLGQKRALQQALLNLVGNALKFTRQGAVSVDVMRLDAQRVEFSVADTGKGIAEEDFEKIFDDFTMLDPSYRRGAEGTGLGLAITRRLVAAMGGEIRCESELGEGSIFSFVIPLPARVPETRPQLAAAELSADARRILIIEDNEINRMLVEAMLVDLGHVVMAAEGGAAGLQLLAANRFDLVVTDISMPDIDGLEVLRRAREARLAEGIEIVALTAHAAMEDHARILKAGFAEVLTKPVNQERLAAMVARRTAHCGEVRGDLPPRGAALQGGDEGGEGPQAQGQAVEAQPNSNGSDISQFVAAVGLEKARHFLGGFCAEVAQLTQDLGEGPQLTEGLRQEAHRLAGSAAVLGLQDLRHCMLAIETADGATPPHLAPLQQAWESAEGVIAAYLAA